MLGYYSFAGTTVMKPFVFLVVLLIVCFPSCIRTDAGLNGPPHITGEVVTKYRFKLGDHAKIDCPIDAANSPIYEWTKDGEAITGAWDRFRVNNKKLRIKGVTAEDGGIYVCKAVNGFGRKEISTRVVVVDENGNVISGDGEDETSGEREKGLDDLSEIMPRIVNMSRPRTGGNTFRQHAGSNLSLFCSVDGQPMPLVSWVKLKDGVQLPKVSGQQKLDLTSISSEDSGTYICLAINEYGQANASFIVEVVDRGMGMLGRPVIVGLEPSNLTVVQGRLIHFRCHISSETLPIVQWLREVDDRQNRARNVNTDGNNNFKQTVPGKYEVINSTNRVISLQNGTFISELTLRTDSRDSGSYVCLATNSEGFDLHKAFLSILPSPDSDSFLPIGVLVAIPSTLLLLFAVLALVICFVRRGHGGDSNGTPTLTITTSATYATPRDVIHTSERQGRHHQNGSSLPFYYKGRTPHIQNGRGSIPAHFGSPQHYYCKEPPLPPTAAAMSTTSILVKSINSSHPSNSAYASVPICESGLPPAHTTTFGANRAPPLPSRPNFPPCNRDKTGYNPNQGLLTQPLLTQTASSSDSRDSRQSNSYRAEYPPVNQRQIEHWGSSGGSESSSDRKNSRSQQIRL